MSTTFSSRDKYQITASVGMLAGQLHLHEFPKCGVVYDCDSRDCLKFQKGCDRCPFSFR